MKFFTFLATLIVVYGLLAQSYADDVANEGDFEQAKDEAIAEEQMAEDVDKEEQPEDGEENENDIQSEDGENSKGNPEDSQDKEKDYLIDGIKHTKTGLKELLQSFVNQQSALYKRFKEYIPEKIHAIQKALEHRREHVKERNENFFNRLREIKDAILEK